MPSLSHSRRVSLTGSELIWRTVFNYWNSFMIPPQFYTPVYRRPNNPNTYYISMMTRHLTRGGSSRGTHLDRRAGPTLRYGPVYRIRSIFFSKRFSTEGLHQTLK